MSPDPICLMTRAEVVDRYFLEHRAKLIDLAAFLDRVDRAHGGSAEDARVLALRRAIRLLDDGQAQRARRVLELFSDLTTEPVERASGKGALGVAPGRSFDETRS